jgi:bacterioferritin-associated ferredoxin
MYICVCKGITDKELREAYQQRKGNVKETLKSLGVASECGVCLTSALSELQEELAHSNENVKPQINSKAS